MAFNLFKKVYVSPDFLYDNGYNRIIFSQWRNQAEYTKYDVLESPGFETSVLLSTASVNDVVGTEPDQFPSIAHYLKHLYDQGWEGRIYADQESYMPLFFTWLKICFPNIDENAAFTLYNIIKQREMLVFPDNRDTIGFLIPRLNDRNTNVILNKTDFITAHNDFNLNDTATADYYAEIRDAMRSDFCTEIHMASYLANKTTIDDVANKLVRFGTKITFTVIEALKDYIRENIMTERIRTLTGVNLSWDDQDWEGTLRNASPLMDFLFSSSSEAIYADYDYRMRNVSIMIEWLQWIIDIDEQYLDDPDLRDIRTTAEYCLRHSVGFTTDTAVRNAAAEVAIQEDINFTGTTLVFQTEDFREKVNTFWLEYIYQLSIASNTVELEKISHT